MIKVFTVNENGKIEFTKAELEKLLNDIYTEGQKNCNCGNGITWTNPYTVPYVSTTTTNEDTTNAIHPTATLNINLSNVKEMSKNIDKIFTDTTSATDVYSKLAKELNF